MNEKQTISMPNDQSNDDDDDGINLIQLLTVLAKHKKRLIVLPLVTAIAAAAISLVIPPVYKATTKILPPQQAQSGAAAILSQLGGVAGAAAGAAGIKNPNDLYIGMLTSRRIADRLIEHFDLKKAYDVTSQEVARRKLELNTTITSGKDGLIVIEVEDLDKQRVAQIANGYTDELLKLTKVLAVTEASQRRLFFERQLQISKDNLANAEVALKGSIEKYGVVSVDSDSRAIVETVSRLRAQIAAKEIHLGAMQAFVTPNNQEYKRAQEELISLRAEFSRLQNGSSLNERAPKNSENQSGLDSIKIVREVKYHQMLYELLSKQYEVARLDEAKDSSIIQVLDSAIEPERRFKPKRAVFVMLFTMFALFVAVLSVFISEAKAKALQVPERAAQWNEFKSHLRWK